MQTVVHYDVIKCHQMETVFTILALFEGKTPGIPSQRDSDAGFDVFFFQLV